MKLEEIPRINDVVDIEKQHEEQDKAVIEVVNLAEIDVKRDIDLMAFHFRSAIFCVKDDRRCDEERLIEYYTPYICSFVQTFYGYIDHMYVQGKWNSKRGNLIEFSKEYECNKIDREEVAAKKIDVEKVDNKMQIWVT